MDNDIQQHIVDFASDDPKTAYRARLAVQKLAHHADTRDQAAKALAGALAATKTAKDDRGNEQTAPEHSAAVRSHCARFLAVCGGDDAVAALQTNLDDLDVRNDCRWALDRIPGDRATTALVAIATDGVGPTYRIGAINSLARRAGDAVVAALKSCLQDGDEDVRQAAAAALAEHGQADNDAALRRARRTGGLAKRITDNARRRLADTLRRGGRHASARRIEADLLRG